MPLDRQELVIASAEPEHALRDHRERWRSFQWVRDSGLLRCEELLRAVVDGPASDQSSDPHRAQQVSKSLL
jgi:hypothetical protein